MLITPLIVRFIGWEGGADGVLYAVEKKDGLDPAWRM